MIIMNKQEKIFDRSNELIPGGVHSPVRSFKGLHTTPRFIKKAYGPYIEDIEDNNYIDFCMSFGPLILGHKNKEVEEELKKALERGWSFGTCEPYSLELAELILGKIKFIEQIRFVNSGTEAVMTALRLARGYTGKNKIIKFNGCYHGHSDSMLIKAGSGLAGTTEASSAGVPASIARDTIVLELGDLEKIKSVIQKEANEIAAVIIEPLPANYGLLIQDTNFLKGLRDLTSEHKILLIFDEVISGFRASFGGMSSKLQIKPDLVTYGKIIGGGLPVGAVAGPKEIMQHLAPLGGVYQAGTLSANPLAMIAGLTTCKRLTQETYDIITQFSNSITNVISRWLNEYDNGRFNDFELVTFESLFWIAPKWRDKDENGEDLNQRIIGPKDIPKDFTDKFYHLFEILLDKGIYISPNAYEVNFLSLAHDHQLVDELEKRLWN